NGRRIGAGDQDHQCLGWSWPAGEMLFAERRGPMGDVIALRFVSANRFAVGVDANRSAVLVYQLDACEQWANVLATQGVVTGIAPSPDGKLLALVTGKGVLEVVRLPAQEAADVRDADRAAALLAHRD